RAGGARGGIGPELHPVGGRLLLGGEELGRIGEEMGGEGTEGAGRSGGVERLGRLWAQRTLGGGAGELDGVGDHFRPGFGELGRGRDAVGKLEDRGSGHGDLSCPKRSHSAISSSSAPQSRGVTKRKRAARSGLRIAQPASGSAGVRKSACCISPTIKSRSAFAAAA